MSKFLKLIIGILLGIFSFSLFAPFTHADLLDEVTSGELQKKLDVKPGQVTINGQGKGVQEVLLYISKGIIMPVVIVITIIVIFVSLNKIMFSSGDEEQKSGRQYLVWGVLGIMIMGSATYIGMSMVGGDGASGFLGLGGSQVNGVLAAHNIYSKIMFPFLKVVIYLVVGILFALLVIQCFRYLSSPSDEMRNHARRIIVWNMVGIIIILLSKNLVELVYGSEQQILSGGSDLGQIGDGILANQNLSLFFTIIEWMMGFISLIVLILIIYQCFLMITRPNDADTTTKLKQNIIYVFIGLLLIGGGYIITNFLLIN